MKQLKKTTGRKGHTYIYLDQYKAYIGKLLYENILQKPKYLLVGYDEDKQLISIEPVSTKSSNTYKVSVTQSGRYISAPLSKVLPLGQYRIIDNKDKTLILKYEPTN